MQVTLPEEEAAPSTEWSRGSAWQPWPGAAPVCSDAATWEERAAHLPHSPAWCPCYTPRSAGKALCEPGLLSGDLSGPRRHVCCL